MPNWPAGDPARPDTPVARRRTTTKRKLGKGLVRVGPVLVILVAAALVLASPALADTPSAPTLNGVIDSLRVWLVGILAGLATLFLTIGGIRYLAAGGDPAEVERAKTALKSAAIGYALAALAPLLVSILQSVVGG